MFDVVLSLRFKWKPKFILYAEPMHICKNDRVYVKQMDDVILLENKWGKEFTKADGQLTSITETLPSQSNFAL